MSLDPLIRSTLSLLNINPDDIRETFLRTGGPGGQHANKNETGVRLTHLPSGIEVRCQSRRSQAQNRQRAWELLLGKLRAHEAALRVRLLQERFRERARRRRRSAGAREQMLQDKRRHAEKKRQRRRVCESPE